MSPKMLALLSTVLPQDLNVGGVTEWSEAKIMKRRREGRLVGRLIMAGFAVGAVLSFTSDRRIFIGILIGGIAGLLLGWCVVGWQRHRAVA